MLAAGENGRAQYLQGFTGENEAGEFETATKTYGGNGVSKAFPMSRKNRSCLQVFDSLDLLKSNSSAISN